MGKYLCILQDFLTNSNLLTINKSDYGIGNVRTGTGRAGVTEPGGLLNGRNVPAKAGIYRNKITVFSTTGL